MNALVRKTASAVAFERSMSLVSKGIDVAMLATLALVIPMYGTLTGLVACFVVGWVLGMAATVFTLVVHMRTSERGFDVTGAADIRAWAYKPTASATNESLFTRLRVASTRFLKWVLRHTLMSYPLMILIGSVVYLEPDYVTILLRKEGEGFWAVITRVSLLSLTWCIVVWTGILWGAYEGMKWAVALA